MAKLKKNSPLDGLSGKLGSSLVFRRMQDGRTVVASVPDFSNRVFSEEQVAHQSRFQQASAYASQASKENPIYAEMAAGTSLNAYNLALSDWFRPPVIQEVTRQADRIYVVATDNVFVAGVRIAILDEQGQTLEQGEAHRVEDDRWEFATAAPAGGAVIAEAVDLAGNRVRYGA